MKQGESLFFTGTVTLNGVPHAAEIEIDRGGVAIATGTADSTGKFKIAWTIPYGLGCTTQSFTAKHPPSGTVSAAQTMKIAYNTRISISAPATVGKGQSFSVTGKLEYESTGAGVWTGLSGKTVSVVYDSTTFGSATTGSDGSFSINGSIGTAGSFTLKATYAGEGLGLSPAEAVVKLFTAGEVEPALIEIGTAALAFAPILFVGSVILANSIGR
jgi:phage tail tape-measure protein